MMTVNDILDQLDIQSEYKVVYWDEDKNERVDLFGVPDALDKPILYMYSEKDIIYFEVKMEEE